MTKKLLFLILILYGSCLSAHTVQDSVKIYFQQGKINLVPDLWGNSRSLEMIADKLQNHYTDSIYQLRRVKVVGGASPEGSITFNRWLSEQRAEVLFNYLQRYGSLPDSLKTSVFLGRDWHGLIRLVEGDMQVPYREETLKLLNQIARENDKGITQGNHLKRIQRLRGGVPYRYMYRNLFPELRASRLYLWFEKVQNPTAVQPVQTETAASVPPIPETIIVHDTIYLIECPPCRPFYMGVKTNMLYDALAVPNIGIEFYLGSNWSITGNWMYAWWKTDRKHWYWRTYGGDLAIRRWFGKAAAEKPLTGHHLGIYGQLLTYDFETGGRGYIGGKPGGSLWDKANWGVGLEYGYSMPIARRLNIDFTIGIGYLGGEYWEYKPVDNCYVWQATKQRHYFGPTKAEISLVWLIGCDNYNRKKGGKR